MALNEAQLLAIQHNKKPMLVLAGPGSGKTTVITYRTKFLIEQCGVSPSNILVITFTKAAAMEMKGRFEALMGASQRSVSFGTFHAVFFLILKYAYHYSAGSIIREEQKIQCMRELLERYQIESEDEMEFISSILAEISGVKGELISLEDYNAKTCSDELFKKMYRGYEENLKGSNRIDFDDMLILCYELLKQREDILKLWQDKYRYILIDEFQDINRVQYEIIRMLAAPEDNLFIVGDDDQSIYRFRGAKPEIMLGFETDYKEAKKVILDVNYRSGGHVVATAACLIGYNKNRFIKNIRANQKAGKPVSFRVYADAREETLEIVKEIADYKAVGYQLSEIAVLYRTNENPRLLIERLMEYHIPFQTKDSTPNLYEHWIARNIISYMKIAAGNRERKQVLQIINRPNRYISRDSMDHAIVSLEALKSFYQDKEWMVERLERLEYDLSMLQSMAPAAAVNYIRKGVGYDAYIKEYAAYRQMNAEKLYEVLDELQESAVGFKTLEAWLLHMEDYKKKLKADMQSKDKKGSMEGVALMTMHSSKGLEYRIVYIIDVNEGIIPHHKAMLAPDIEEERRMLYVAMTRAKERLFLCSLNERYGKKQSPSRFLEECLKDNSSQ